MMICDTAVPRIDGATLCTELLKQQGFRTPMIARTVASIDGMEMPAAGELTVEKISEMVGPDVVMPVLDVGPQEEVAMSLSAWEDYWNDPSRSRRLNVTSLEITGTELANLTRTAACVRELDWIDNMWPSELKEISMARLCGATSKFGVGDSTVGKVDPTDLTSMCNVDPCGAYKKKTKWAAPTALAAAAEAANVAEEAENFLENGNASAEQEEQQEQEQEQEEESEPESESESPPVKRVTRGAVTQEDTLAEPSPKRSKSSPVTPHDGKPLKTAHGFKHKTKQKLVADAHPQTKPVAADTQVAAAVNDQSWSAEEDAFLVQWVVANGARDWNSCAAQLKTGRSGSACGQHYRTNLRPTHGHNEAPSSTKTKQNKKKPVAAAAAAAAAAAVVGTQRADVEAAAAGLSIEQAEKAQTIMSIASFSAGEAVAVLQAHGWSVEVAAAALAAPSDAGVAAGEHSAKALLVAKLPRHLKWNDFQREAKLAGFVENVDPSEKNALLADAWRYYRDPQSAAPHLKIIPLDHIGAASRAARAVAPGPADVRALVDRARRRLEAEAAAAAGAAEPAVHAADSQIFLPDHGAWLIYKQKKEQADEEHTERMQARSEAKLERSENAQKRLERESTNGAAKRKEARHVAWAALEKRSRAAQKLVDKREEAEGKAAVLRDVKKRATTPPFLKCGELDKLAELGGKPSPSWSGKKGAGPAPLPAEVRTWIRDSQESFYMQVSRADLLLAACSLLLAPCCLLLAPCCLRLAACSLLLAACSLLLAACSLVCSRVNSSC